MTATPSPYPNYNGFRLRLKKYNKKDSKLNKKYK